MGHLLHLGSSFLFFPPALVSLCTGGESQVCGDKMIAHAGPVVVVLWLVLSTYTSKPVFLVHFLYVWELV